MNTAVIRGEGLSKRYRRGALQQSTLLRDHLSRALRSPLSVFRRPKDETFWALHDVSLDVHEGEVLGLIGRNGAGKTTLLKILSRITRPTSGWAEIHGRVGSLLEVGTGFHPELTGRENTFLSGAILGMSRREITAKFDEIVAFAELGKFIDTSVKHYSSGMYVRLAFAVAAHLEPEILLVDEVLAVGDINFQKKCLGKMGDVARAGRTVVLVSHNMGAITRLCTRALRLDCGRIIKSGPVEEVVADYLSSGTEAEGERIWPRDGEGVKAKGVSIQALRVLNLAGLVTSTVDIRQAFVVEIQYAVLRTFVNLRIAIRVLSSDGTVVFTSSESSSDAWEGSTRRPGIYVSRCEIPGNFLNEGHYSLTVTADVPFVEIALFEEGALGFGVEQTGGASGRYPERWPGVVCPILQWQVERLGELSGQKK